MLWVPQTKEEYDECKDFMGSRGVVITPHPHVRFLVQLGGKSNGTRHILAVVAFADICGRTCHIHVAGDGNWLSRKLLWAAFDFPFNKCGFVEVFAPTSSENARAVKLITHLGFIERYIVEGGYNDGTDTIVFSMRKSECRWLKRLVLKEKDDGQGQLATPRT